MPEPVPSSIAAHFRQVPDPRVRRTRRHTLEDILVITRCAVICGADDWVSIAHFGHAKRKWFRRFLALPHGIPSHETFGRVFAALAPEAFKAAFLAWVATVADLLPGDVIAIDGKMLRRTFDTAAEKAAIHMVSAWATAQGVCLGQVKTDAKSNEITAIPKLLEVLALTGRVVTIDAMGCPTAIARAIHAKGGDSVLSLKGNQTRLHDDRQRFFADAEAHAFQGIPHTVAETVDGDHGRIAVRRAGRPTTSPGWPIGPAGPACAASCASMPCAPSASARPAKPATSSPACPPTRRCSPVSSAVTGRSRTAVTGCSMSP